MATTMMTPRSEAEIHHRKSHADHRKYSKPTSRAIATRAAAIATIHHQSKLFSGNGSGSGSGSGGAMTTGAGSGISTGWRLRAQRTQISAAGEFGSEQCGQISAAVAARPTVPGSRRSDAPDSAPSGAITVPRAQNKGKSHRRQKSSACLRAMSTVASWPHSGQVTTSVPIAARVGSLGTGKTAAGPDPSTACGRSASATNGRTGTCAVDVVAESESVATWPAPPANGDRPPVQAAASGSEDGAFCIERGLGMVGSGWPDARAVLSSAGGGATLVQCRWRGDLVQCRLAGATCGQHVPMAGRPCPVPMAGRPYPALT